LRVTDIVAESPTVSSIRLATPDGTPLPAARPGQYLTVRIGSAVRNYSLSALTDTGTYRISVKHEPHGVASGYLTTSLRPDADIEVAAPRGDFVLGSGPEPVLLISAGIGVTPVLAMLADLAAQASTREIWWIHAARSAAEHPHAAEAQSLLAALPNGHEHVFYSTTGRLTGEALAALAPPTDASAYLCGPASFMADMQGALTTIGLDAARIHTEVFAALPSLNPGLVLAEARPPHQPPGPPGTGPPVTFARSGITTPFPTGLGSVLDLADACDVPTRWSCRTGVCQTCSTPVLSGSVVYDPEPLEPPPAGEALLCCARPDADLVLDM
jgi:ferredoxin-NADP reductase/ferredoxin